MGREVDLKKRLSSSQLLPQELEDLEDCTVGGNQDSSDLDGQLDHDALVNDERIRGIYRTLMELPKEARNLVAGGFAGMLAKSVVAPLDRVKILFQVSSCRFRLRNVPRVMSNIVKDEGFGALWKGNVATMIRVFPYSGIQFAIFDRCKAHFLQKHEREENIHITEKRWGLTPLESLLSGMMAGTVSVIATYPLDLTRAQLAVLRKHRNGEKNRGFRNVLIDTYQQRGVAGLFRGVVPTMMGILPYSGIAFALNEQGKREIQHLTGREVTTIERMQCGAFAGLIAQSVTYPIEVTRRRMQTIGLVGTDTALSSVGENNYKNAATLPTLRDTVKALYREQGARGFFKGVTMNWMKGPIAFSISFTAFDTFQSLLESERDVVFRFPKRMLTRKEG